MGCSAVCFPSFNGFSWEDSNHVITIFKEGNPYRTYGNRSKDTREDVRLKMAGLFLVSGVITLWQQTLIRIGALLTGSFVRRGKEIADWEWKVVNYGVNEKDQTSYLFTAAKCTISFLAQDIAKLVTTPLAIIAKELCALYGILDPYGGRHLFSECENIWAIGYQDTYNSWEQKLLIYGSYTGLCMQSKEYSDRFNVFRGESDNRNELLKLSNRINLIRDLSPTFFEGRNEECDRLLNEIQEKRSAYTSIQNHRKAQLAAAKAGGTCNAKVSQVNQELVELDSEDFIKWVYQQNSLLDGLVLPDNFIEQFFN